METSEERWLPVPGTQGHYEVSDLGNVRSVDRYIEHRAYNQGDVHMRAHVGFRRGVPIKPYLRGRYLNVNLGDSMRNQSIAGLVLEAFVGPRPPGNVIRHLDDSYFDNRLVNLAWCTPQENHADKVRNGNASYEHLWAHNRGKTHCPYGHPYSGDNLSVYVNKDGAKSRGCRTCRRSGKAERKAK